MKNTGKNTGKEEDNPFIAAELLKESAGVKTREHPSTPLRFLSHELLEESRTAEEKLHPRDNKIKFS